jgi:hypothetical protein
MLTTECAVELQTRREAILSCIASIQRQFVQMYSSSERQCQRGYDSSPACDSFQLGQMMRFLLNKELLYLVDFSTKSWDAVPDRPIVDISSVIALLRKCPSYQIDKFHTNCGLRTRILPILDYVQALTSSPGIGVYHHEWENSRHTATWSPNESEDTGDIDRKTFRFTSNLAGDSRLRIKEGLGTANLARSLFTADSWDWTYEYRNHQDR